MSMYEIQITMYNIVSLLIHIIDLGTLMNKKLCFLISPE